MSCSDFHISLLRLRAGAEKAVQDLRALREVPFAESRENRLVLDFLQQN